MGLGAERAALGGCQWYSSRSVPSASVPRDDRSVRRPVDAAARGHDGRVGSHRNDRVQGSHSRSGGPKATKKHKFVKAWVQEHVNDHWVKEATRLGYRSRAAFKLLELAEKDKLFRPGMSVVDLGSAPGSWAQVLHERLGPKARIVAIDLLPMDPMRGVDVHPGRFPRADGLAGGRGGARRTQGRPCRFRPGPQSVGCRGRRIRRGRCIWASWRSNLRCNWLQPGGDLVVKAFQGSGFAEFQRAVPKPVSRRCTYESRRRRAIAAARSIWWRRGCAAQRADGRSKADGSDQVRAIVACRRRFRPNELAGAMPKG